MVFDINNPQSIDPIKAAIRPQKSEAQINCEAKGGSWKDGKCILQQKEKIKEDIEPKAKLTSPEVIREDGKVTGIVLPDGRVYSGVGGKVVEGMLKPYREEEQKFGDVPDVGTAQKEADEMASIESERQRLNQEEIPQRRELDPEITTLEGIPVLGPILQKTRDLLRSVSGTPKDVELSPEQLRTKALSQIEKQEIERGLTLNEKFGSLVESIPLIGSLASKFAGGLIETPSENAREVKSNILKEKRRITNIETNVKLGYLPVSIANEQIVDIENNVQRLESRIRLLVNSSPELKFNSDYVNTVETEILATREKAFQAKQNILTGATQDPDELEILMKLQYEEEQ